MITKEFNCGGYTYICKWVNNRWGKQAIIYTDYGRELVRGFCPKEDIDGFIQTSKKYIKEICG